MSHQKHKVSVRDLNSNNHHGADLKSGNVQPAKVKVTKQTQKYYSNKHNAGDTSTDNELKFSYSLPTINSSRDRCERRFINQKLHEIEVLRAKIDELECEISNQEEIEQKVLVEKRSSCFSCLKLRYKKSNSPTEIISLLPSKDKNNDDRLSTQVICNSSRETITKYPTLKHHHRKKKKERNAEKRKRVKCTEKSKSPIINNTNVPETKVNSSEEIITISAKLQKQGDEIRAIRISLEECLSLLKNNKDDKAITKPSYEKSPVVKPPIIDDVIYLRRMGQNSDFGNVLTNFTHEREMVNILAPQTTKAFPCTCEQDPYQSSRLSKQGSVCKTIVLKEKTDIYAPKGPSKCCGKKSKKRVVKYCPSKIVASTNTSNRYIYATKSKSNTSCRTSREMELKVSALGLSTCSDKPAKRSYHKIDRETRTDPYRSGSSYSDFQMRGKRRGNYHQGMDKRYHRHRKRRKDYHSDKYNMNPSHSRTSSCGENCPGRRNPFLRCLLCLLCRDI